MAMNFSPFGSHFSTTSIPNIHQFAAKFSQENNSLNPETRYTSDDIQSFNQLPSLSQGGYPNQHTGTYSQLEVNRGDKRDGFEQTHMGSNVCGQVSLQQEKCQKVKDVLQNPLTVQVNTSWQSLATPGSTVADYLSQLPSTTLPLSLHHFLKYSAESIKKESTNQLIQNHDLLPSNNTINQLNNLSSNSLTNFSNINQSHFSAVTASMKKKKKKKIEKEKKPRPKPGEIRLTTALDGSTLYCCPECHMAYPEKELLEQHLSGHTLERRFVCDICGAGLKRKDHLTRHKQSHNPERPYVCSVCLKAFKRKEQLTLHFVIHSGEKRHICQECGKGFYRKDHLRKHTRSHIARRVKAELSQQNPPVTERGTVA